MKKILMLLSGILIAGVSFIGCKKDSDDEKANQFMVADTTISIATFQLEYWGLSNGVQEFYLDFLTPDLLYSADALVGEKGSLIYFEFESDDATGIPTGEYDINILKTTGGSAFSSGSYCLDWITGVGGDWGSVSSGTLSVTRDGNNYEISFNGKGSDDEIITLYFKGTCTFSDFSGSGDTKSTRSNR